MAERILMGEAGGEGYIGMALVAQCIRDTYVNGSYSSIAQLLEGERLLRLHIHHSLSDREGCC